MADIKKKKIMEKAKRYNKALLEGAPTAEFKGRTQAALDAQITALETKEDARAGLMAQVNLLDDEIEDDYIHLEDELLEYRSGVEGHKDFGNDSPLYGAMGHTRKSERRSGLHRNKPGGETPS